MEDKRLREEEMKRKAAEEDAKEDRRIAEQQARIAREYEDEIKQRKGTSLVLASLYWVNDWILCFIVMMYK